MYRLTEDELQKLLENAYQGGYDCARMDERADYAQSQDDKDEFVIAVINELMRV